VVLWYKTQVNFVTDQAASKGVKSDSKIVSWFCNSIFFQILTFTCKWSGKFRKSNWTQFHRHQRSDVNMIAMNASRTQFHRHQRSDVNMIAMNASKAFHKVSILTIFIILVNRG